MAVASGLETGRRHPLNLDPVKTTGTTVGEASSRPHLIHVNGHSLDGTSLFIQHNDVKFSTLPHNENTRALRGDLFLGTTDLFDGFERVFGRKYTGGRSPKSFIGLAVDISIKGTDSEEEGAKWTAHHSPLTEGTGGEYVYLQRVTDAYNGFEEVSQLSFVKPTEPRGQVEPSISFTSYLRHKNTNPPNSGERLEIVSPDNNTYASWGKASQLMGDFAEIAKLPTDRVSFTTLASRSRVVTQEEIHARVAPQRTELVASVENHIPMQRADGTTHNPDGTRITRAQLVDEAKTAGVIYANGEKPKNLPYPTAYNQIEAAAINGPREHTLFAPTPPKESSQPEETALAKFFRKREEERRAITKWRVEHNGQYPKMRVKY